MSRSWWRRNRLTILIAAAITTSPCWGGCGVLLIRKAYIHQFVLTDEDREFLRNPDNGYRGGLPSAGHRLKAEMESIPDPVTALQLHPDWATIRFPNGEWVFGHGIDSHGFATGHGTLVIKDSRGKVRIYFGHVCGENMPLDFGWDFIRNAKTLDDFYTGLQDRTTLREWKP
jgi:hypothetical protein